MECAFLAAKARIMEADAVVVAAVMSTPTCVGCRHSDTLHRNTKTMSADERETCIWLISVHTRVVS